MPPGIPLQFAATGDPPKSTDARSAPANSTGNSASQLSEAIDGFLADVEKKFKVMNDDILSKLDDMAERCDRLEAELMLNERDGAKMDSDSNHNS